ncbi:MAG: T9SS type A sorting domain-containing protein [Bacteroidota bacterium]
MKTKNYLQLLKLLSFLLLIAGHGFSQIFPPQPLSNDPHRGLMVDQFIRFYNQSPDAGQARLNPDHSIFAVDQNNDGIYEKEQELFKFCNDNHITHITLYDLRRVFTPWNGQDEIKVWDHNSNTYLTLREHLCRFVHDARASGITEIAISGGGQLRSILNSAAFRQPTPEITFTAAEMANPYISTRLLYVTNPINNGDPKTEFMKFILRSLGFGGCHPCTEWFDYVDFEDEFWNGGDFFVDVAPVLHDLYDAQQAYNSTNTLHPVTIEIYIGGLDCQAAVPQPTARYIDGCPTCPPFFTTCNVLTGGGHPRVANKINLTYYLQLVGPSNYSGYYNVDRIPSLNDALTENNTHVYPLINAEDREWGGYNTFLGSFFRSLYPESQIYGNYLHNIFNSELMLYLGYISQDLSATSTHNIVFPGGTTWYAASQMCGKLFDPDPPAAAFPNLQNRRLDVPTIFSISESLSPTDPIQITYQGPIEQVTNFSVDLFDLSMNLQCNLLNVPATSLITGTTAFPNTFTVAPCPGILSGSYVAVASITYSNGYTYQQREHFDLYVVGTSVATIKILNDPDLYVPNPAVDDANGKDEINVCEGQVVTLAAPSFYNGWLRNGQPYLQGYNSSNTQYLVVTESGTYELNPVGGWVVSSNAITVNFLRNPRTKIVATPGSGVAPNIDVNLSVLTLGDGANATSQYNWSTGETTQAITAIFNHYSSVPHYQVTITQPNGCLRTEKINVPLDQNGDLAMAVANPTPTINIATVNDDCGTLLFDGEAHITTTNATSGSFQAFITPGNGQILEAFTNNPAFDFTGLESGDYTFHLIYDSYGSDFDYTQTFHIGNNGTVYTLTPVLTQTTTCQHDNGQINLTGNIVPAAYTSLVWSPTGQTVEHITNLTPGSYRVDILDLNNCPSFQSFTINQPANPLIVKRAAVTNRMCTNAGTTLGSIFINNTPNGWGYEGGVSPYEISIAGPSNQTANNVTSSHTFSNLGVGDYTLTVTDNNGAGCSSSIQVHVGDVIPIEATIDQMPTGCASATVDIEINACGGEEPYQYNLDNTGNVTSNTFMNLSPGVHVITITDANGCVYTNNNVVINAPDFLSAVVNITNACPGSDNGTATAIGSGGTPPYSFVWNNGNSTYQATNLAAGNYSVTVTDGNGCTFVTNNTVGTDPVINIADNVTMVCTGGNYGSIDITPTGGQGNYTYFWSPIGTTTEDVANATPGVYSVQVTDDIGCTASSTWDIADLTCCGNYFPNTLTQTDFNFGSPTISSNSDLSTSVNIGFGSSITISGAQIAIAPGVTINVQNGGTLTVTTNAHLFACGDMWGGIVVEPGGSVIVNGNSILADAEHAIFANTTVGTTSSINVRSGIFNSNYVGIFVQTTGNGQFNTINLTVTGSRFDCPYILKFSPNINPLGATSFAGIELNDLNGIIGDNFANSNNFQNMNNGIVSRQCILTVRNSNFNRIRRELIYNNYYDGSGIYASGKSPNYLLHVYGTGKFNVVPCFIRCDYGIFVDGVPGFARTMHMGGAATSDNVTNGVYVTNLAPRSGFSTYANWIECDWAGIEYAFNPNGSNIQVYGNIIDVSNGTGIGAYEIGASPTNFRINNNNVNVNSGIGGIQLFGMRGLSVDHNLVHLNHNVNNRFGIGVNVSDKNTLNCNDVIGINGITQNRQIAFAVYLSQKNGIECNNTSLTNTGFEFNDQCPATRLNGNVMENQWIGLQVLHAGWIGPQFEAGNQWTANSFSGPLEAEHLVNFGFSRIDAHPVATYTPLARSPIAGWFFPDFTTVYDCVVNRTCGSDPIGTGDDGHGGQSPDLLIASGNYHADEFDEENQWRAEKYLFEKLDNDPSLIDNSTLQDFYDEKSNSPIADFNSIQKDVVAVSDLPSAEAEQLINSSAALEGLQAQLEFFDSLFTGTGDTTIVDSIDIVKNQIISVTGANTTLIEDISAAQTQQIDDIIQENSGISVTEQYKANEQQVNNIYLNSLAKGDRNISSPDQSTLLSIAHQCPYAGGKPVYLARALYRVINPYETYDDDDVCTQLGYYRKSNPHALAITYSFMYPNPTDKEITLSYYLTDKKPTQLRIFDSSLQLIAQEELNQMQTSKSLTLESISSGLYLYNIIQDGNVVSLGKFSVAH